MCIASRRGFSALEFMQLFSSAFRLKTQHGFTSRKHGRSLPWQCLTGSWQSVLPWSPALMCVWFESTPKTDHYHVLQGLQDV